MERHFSPGFKRKQLLLVGSQTHVIWKNIAKEQAQEGFYLAGACNNHVGVARNIDPNYLKYWSSLMEGSHVINLTGLDEKKYLSEAIIEHAPTLEKIREQINSRFYLLPFLITPFEQKLANKLGINIHGSKKMSDAFGTKSGSRRLARLAHIPVAPGFRCSSIKEIKSAMIHLRDRFDWVVIKHDTSVSGYLNRKIRTSQIGSLDQILTKLLHRRFKNGKDIVVVEGWLTNCVSIGAHIELLPGKTPTICAAWQQVIDTDGISYMGAGPLTVSSQALQNLKNELQKLARVLAKKGAIGSYGPDFLITSEDNKYFKPDTAVLIELNARIPYTAFPLEAIKQVKGAVGSGFCSTRITLRKRTTFTDIAKILSEKRLLITKKDYHATGVIPFNVGMLPWKSFNVIAMGDTWEETQHIVQKTKYIFGDLPVH